MKRLTLLRHAKSSWTDTDLPDFDRPLNDRGIRDAPIMSQRILDSSWMPDHILCSAANRTRQTAQIVLDTLSLDKQHITYHDSLYLASAGTLLDHIQNTANTVQHLMLIAHNPGLETLGRQLHPDAPSKLATCAVLNFEIHNSNFTIEPDTQVDLVLHDYPKKS